MFWGGREGKFYSILYIFDCLFGGLSVSCLKRKLKSKNYLIIRPGHKPNPFPYDKAWVNQLGNFDYVETICKQMVDLIDEDMSGVYNIGTEMKSMYDLAVKTKPNVNPY